MSEAAKTVVDAFLAAQREMYDGGSVDPVSELIADEVVWHVPGTSPIAGDYRGKEAVLDYFRARRAMAAGRIEITQHGELIGDDVVVQLADGHARLGWGKRDGAPRGSIELRIRRSPRRGSCRWTRTRSTRPGRWHGQNRSYSSIVSASRSA